ncbi:uncharacterized protein MAM_06980 [Metarhizium album ARSEF 1941]|uniref:Uncharacterized protein n=1 Tax=Metarhizium album (strain ARSEF 1941) TaxID=1081103 RepID=A0A0B2WQ25_METAS|nr:uncharacterized protein MAM_06980 [Metarhizium album ARSEF 1941]KHN95095.1 hypothetical protein MAM_06980 [Metarhizium album ARSEF 1941]
MPSLRGPDELIQAEHVVSKAAHRLAIRGECNETADLFQPVADAMTARGLGFSGTMSASHLVTEVSQAATTASAGSTSESTGESTPASTQTAPSTARNTSEERTLTSTTTSTVTVTVSPDQYSDNTKSQETCHGETTETVTVTVTVYPAPDVTITAGASTVTEASTDVSYTTRLPDVTLSGNPSTYTAIQTDVSVTTGLPDATVSGEASTVTDVETSWSWSLPSTYASPFTTVTISNLWGSAPPADTSVESGHVSLSTLTTVVYSQVTITLSYPAPTPSASSEVAGEATSTSGPSPTSTYTEFVTETGGPPAIETTTVDVLPPAYTSYNTSSASSAAPSVVIVSDGSKRPEPKAWGGSNGGSNVACTVMLVAILTFLL